MSDSPTPQDGSVAEPAPPAETELLSWRSMPARRSVKRTVAVTLTIIGVPTLLMLWYGPFFGVLGIVILGGSLLSFFLPTDYILTDRAIQRRYLGIEQKRNWSEFRSYYPDKNGVLLSPFVRPSRLENFRGLYLRFEDNRDEVLAVVKSKVSHEPVGDKT